MEFFILLSATIVVSVTLFYLYLKKKYYFVKPSIIFILFFNVFLQWPAIFYFNIVETSLNSSRFGFIMMFSVSPCFALLISLLFRRSAIRVYQSLDKPMIFSPAIKWFLFLCILLGPIIYFQYVSFNNTGLVSILRGDPYLESSVIRERSMKLLPALPRYFHSMSLKVCSFLLILILISEISTKSTALLKTFRYSKIVFLAIFTLLFLAIDGSRAPGALVFLCILFFLIYNKGIHLGAVFNFKTIILISIIIFIPSAMEYMRGDSKDIATTMNIFFERIFFIRFESGILNIKYSEIYGHWGVAALGNISGLFGVKGVNVANFVANMEYFTPTESALANASFMMTYYAYFGIIAIPLSVGLILLLDTSLWFVANKIRNNLYIFAVVGYAIAIYGLIDADYTTILFTQGLFFNHFILYLVSKFHKSQGPNFNEISTIN